MDITTTTTTTTTTFNHVHTKLQEKDILHLQNLKKIRVNYLNALVNKKSNQSSNNEGNTTSDNVYLPKRINYESLVNEYGNVKMLHTFKITKSTDANNATNNNNTNQMINYIMTIHESSVIFWQQEQDKKQEEDDDDDDDVDNNVKRTKNAKNNNKINKKNKKKKAKKTNKWKCFNMFSFQHIKNISERRNAITYSHVIPIESLSNDKTIIIAAFEANCNNKVWIYELDVELVSNTNSTNIGSTKKKKRKRKATSTIYTEMKNTDMKNDRSISNIQIAMMEDNNNNTKKKKKKNDDQEEKNGMYYNKIRIVRDNIDHGTYLISSSISSDLETEQLRQENKKTTTKKIKKNNNKKSNDVIPLLSLHKVIYDNNKENSNQTLLKTLHTFNIDLNQYIVNDDLNRNDILITVDDLSITNYGNEKDNNMLPPLVGCLFVITNMKNDTSITYFQLWDVEAKLMLKQLKIAINNNTNMKKQSMMLTRTCSNLALFPILNKASISPLKRKENVIDMNIVIHCPSFTTTTNNNTTEEKEEEVENVTLIFAGRYFYVALPPSQNTFLLSDDEDENSSKEEDPPIWQWRSNPILLDQNAFGFPKGSSILGSNNNYQLCKLNSQYICLFDMTYGHGILLNLFDDRNNYNEDKKQAIHFAFTSSSTTDIKVLNDSLSLNVKTDDEEDDGKKILLTSICDSHIYIYTCHEAICNVFDVMKHLV